MIFILMKKLGRERVDNIEENQLFKNITSDAVPTKAQALSSIMSVDDIGRADSNIGTDDGI